MKRVLLLALLVGCGPKHVAGTGTGSGTGTGTGSAMTAATCADATANVTALYEAEAKATDQGTHDPTFVDDNVAMVMKDCAADPAKVAACAKAAQNVADLEQHCLVPLDEEGTEGGKTP